MAGSSMPRANTISGGVTPRAAPALDTMVGEGLQMPGIGNLPRPGDAQGQNPAIKELAKALGA